LQCVHQGVSAVSDALQLVEKIRSDLTPLAERILGHPYLHALEQGRVPLDSLKVFAGQQHHIISSDLRSIALILSREGMRPSRRFLMNVLQGEAAALDALHAFAGALGLNISDLEVLEPLPAAHAYCTFVAWLALYGSDAELAGALLVNFPAWGANCGRMRAALREKYGLAPSALAFFDLFADIPSFEQEAVAIMQNALDRGLPARLIHRAARMLQGYELMFWDAMAGVAGARLDRGE
jgi:pyrroloquinoline quinone (PQQ) biosynthesis protein C